MTVNRTIKMMDYIILLKIINSGGILILLLLPISNLGSAFIIKMNNNKVSTTIEMYVQ